MSERTWWCCTMRIGERVYLPPGDGEMLAQKLAEYKERVNGQDATVEVEDVCGSRFVIALSDIVLLWDCTPASRVADLAEDGLMADIREHAKACKAHWDWEP